MVGTYNINHKNNLYVLSKISVNEEYNWNDIRKAIDYFCHFAKTPIDFDNIKEDDKDFSNKDIFNKITWINDNNDDYIFLVILMLGILRY